MLDAYCFAADGTQLCAQNLGFPADNFVVHQLVSIRGRIFATCCDLRLCRGACMIASAYFLEEVDAAAKKWSIVAEFGGLQLPNIVIDEQRGHLLAIFAAQWWRWEILPRGLLLLGIFEVPGTDLPRHIVYDDEGHFHAYFADAAKNWVRDSDGREIIVPQNVKSRLLCAASDAEGKNVFVLRQSAVNPLRVRFLHYRRGRTGAVLPVQYMHGFVAKYFGARMHVVRHLCIIDCGVVYDFSRQKIMEFADGDAFFNAIRMSLSDAHRR